MIDSEGEGEVHGWLAPLTKWDAALLQATVTHLHALTSIDYQESCQKLLFFWILSETLAIMIS